MSKNVKKYYLALVLAGIMVCLISLNTISRLLVDSAILDLTENKKYSLSQFSCEQPKKLLQPLYLTVYYSTDIAQENPVYAKYAEYVMRFLQQYQRCNQNKIFIAIKNPKPYSEVEKEAQKEGITPIPSLTGQNNLYFGIVFKDADGKKEVIPEFSIERDFWLEKDITTVLMQYNEPKRRKVGIISPIHKVIKRTYGKGTEKYAFLDELDSRYNLVELAPNVTDIPENIDTLMVIAPIKMPKSLMFALDQYVLRGGKLIMLLDAYIEEPQYKLTYEQIGELNSLLKNWGVEMGNGIIGSQQYGKKEFIGDDQNGWRQTPYPIWMNLLPPAVVSVNDLDIKNIRLRSAIEIKEVEHDEDSKVIPILKLEKGGVYELFDNLKDKQSIVKNYQEEAKAFNLGVLITGKFHSSFMEIPQSVTLKEHNYLFYSKQPAQILLIGDSDLIRDNVWLEGSDLSDNGQLLLKIIEIFNNAKDMAALYKSQTKMTQESLGSKIYAQITEKNMAEISKMQNELEQLTEEHNNMRLAIEQKMENFTAMTAIRDSEIKERVEELQQKLQYYNYSIKNAFASKRQNIIFINLLVFPVCILVLWIGIYHLISRRNLKKIKEKFDVHK